MKRCSTSLVVRETQTKTTIRSHYTPLEWLKLRRLSIPNVGKDVELLELTCKASQNVKWYKLSRKQFGSFLIYKVFNFLKLCIPLDPTILFYFYYYSFGCVGSLLLCAGFL